MLGAAGLTVGVGKGFTVIVTEAVPVQPFVTYTVYVVVIVGEATGFAMVALLNPVAGAHE